MSFIGRQPKDMSILYGTDGPRWASHERHLTSRVYKLRTRTEQ